MISSAENSSSSQSVANVSVLMIVSGSNITSLWKYSLTSAGKLSSLKEIEVFKVSLEGEKHIKSITHLIQKHLIPSTSSLVSTPAPVHVRSTAWSLPISTYRKCTCTLLPQPINDSCPARRGRVPLQHRTLKGEGEIWWRRPPWLHLPIMSKAMGEP